MTNTEILCFILGWQGGTIHQVLEVFNKYQGALEDRFTDNDITDAGHEKFRELCRKAQDIRRKQTRQIDSDERERCAKVAESFPAECEYAAQMTNWIAARIRSGF